MICSFEANNVRAFDILIGSARTAEGLASEVFAIWRIEAKRRRFRDVYCMNPLEDALRLISLLPDQRSTCGVPMSELRIGTTSAFSARKAGQEPLMS
jgi:hypothetical protein